MSMKISEEKAVKRNGAFPEMSRKADELCAAISGRITVALTRQRRTARELAQTAGIADNTLRCVLAGRNSTIATLQAIALALDVPLADLVKPVENRNI